MLRKMISFVLRFWLFLRYRRSHYNTNAVAKHFVVVLQSLSRARLFATPWTIFTRPPCPSPPPRVCPSSYSLHQWCHLATSSSDALFSFCPQSFPASGTFPMSYLFTSDDQNTGASASASVLPVNIQIDRFDLLAVRGTFRSLLQNHSSKASFLWYLAFLMVQLSQLYVTTGKTTAFSLEYTDLCQQSSVSAFQHAF